MSRKEVIVLVSRAFAAIQLATALLEISYLPERLFSMHHHASLVSVLSVSAADSYWRTYDQIDILSLISSDFGAVDAHRCFLEMRLLGRARCLFRSGSA